MNQTDLIKKEIIKRIPSAQIHILDPRNDGIHLEALVIAEEFREIPLFKQHQLVMNSLKDFFATSLHALGLKTFTPEKWESEKEKYL